MPDSRPIGFADLSDLKILVVDDNADGLDLLRTVFQRCGAIVSTARDVDTALAVLRTGRFDAVVSDLAMPIRDGLELIRSVRESAGDERKIAAIAITGFYEEYAAPRAREAGFDVFLQKPVDPVVLGAGVRAAIDLRNPR
jgi:CheY-like chemotaxis protein